MILAKEIQDLVEKKRQELFRLKASDRIDRNARQTFVDAALEREVRIEELEWEIQALRRKLAPPADF